jgi:hypothetical protein
MLSRDCLACSSIIAFARRRQCAARKSMLDITDAAMRRCNLWRRAALALFYRGLSRTVGRRYTGL